MLTGSKEHIEYLRDRRKSKILGRLWTVIVTTPQGRRKWIADFDNVLSQDKIPVYPKRKEAVIAAKHMSRMAWNAGRKYEVLELFAL